MLDGEYADAYIKRKQLKILNDYSVQEYLQNYGEIHPETNDPSMVFANDMIMKKKLAFFVGIDFNDINKYQNNEEVNIQMDGLIHSF